MPTKPFGAGGSRRLGWKGPMKRILAVLLASLLLPVAALLAAGLQASPAVAAAPGLEGQYLAVLNADRTARGLGPLTLDPGMTGIARGWADHLLAQGGLSHNPSLVGQLPGGWQRYGENVGEGSDVTTLETTFMNSPEHRANILGDYETVGVGIDVRIDGTLFITVDFLKGGRAAASCTSTNPPDAPSPAAARGYYVLGSDGGIFAYGAPFLGSVPGDGVRARAVLMAVTPDQGGYWVLGSDGGVFTFGDAPFLGSVPGLGAHAVGVDLKSSATGHGYWVLGQDGSVYAFGDAQTFGSLPGVGVHNQAVKLVPTPSGRGYWILGADGGIFSFGDAAFLGSLPGIGVHNTSVSMSSTSSGRGYWVLGADGGIFSFGDAQFHGSVPGIGCQTAVGVQVAATSTGNGYYVLSGDGRVFPFGDGQSYGDPSGLRVTTLDLAVLHT